MFQVLLFLQVLGSLLDLNEDKFHDIDIAIKRGSSNMNVVSHTAERFTGHRIVNRVVHLCYRIQNMTVFNERLQSVHIHEALYHVISLIVIAIICQSPVTIFI